jgi:hypothetical protein
MLWDSGVSGIKFDCAVVTCHSAANFEIIVNLQCNRERLKAVVISGKEAWHIVYIHCHAPAQRRYVTLRIVTALWRVFRLVFLRGATDQHKHSLLVYIWRSGDNVWGQTEWFASCKNLYRNYTEKVNFTSTYITQTFHCQVFDYSATNFYPSQGIVCRKCH